MSGWNRDLGSIGRLAHIVGMVCFLSFLTGFASATPRKLSPEQRERALWHISLTGAESPQGVKAAQELFSLALKNPSRSAEICDRLLLVPAYQKGLLGQQLRQLREEQLYRSILKISSEDSKAQQFAEFYSRFPQSPLAKRALFRAASIYESLGHSEKALELLVRHLALIPADPDRVYLRQEQLRLSERSMLWSQAKSYAEELLLLEPESEHRLVWRTKLCRFDQLVAWSDAHRSCAFQNEARVDKSVQWLFIEAMKAKGEIYRLASFARDHYLIRNDLSIEERLQALKIIFLEENLAYAQREEAKQEILQLYAEHLKDLSPGAREVIAAIAYHSLRDSYQTFDRMVVQAIDRDSFLNALQNQKQAFDELESLSGRVWKVSDARWGSQVLLEMAKATLHFSSQLRSIPEMESVDKKQIEAELKARQAQLKAKAKAQVSLAEKAVLRHGVLRDSNRHILGLSRTLRESPLVFDDKFPPAMWVSHEAD